MRALFGVVANRVEFDPDLTRLSIVGIFHELHAPTFPYVIETLGVAARFEIAPEELGRGVTANVALEKAGGRRSHIDQRQRLLPTAARGRPVLWDFALNLSRVEFDAPGSFHIVLRVDKEIVAEVPLWVIGPSPD